MTSPRIERVLEAHPDIDKEDVRNLLVLAYLNANSMQIDTHQHLEETTQKLVNMKDHAIKALITSIK